MTKCPMCKRGVLRAAKVSHRLALGEHLFTGDLRGLQCDHCDEGFVADRALEEFEASVAVRLAESGFRSGDAVRFVRKAAGVKATDVADLFGVSLQTVSAWENGKHPADNATRAVLAALALDARKGATTTRERLVAMQRIAPPAASKPNAKRGVVVPRVAPDARKAKTKTVSSPSPPKRPARKTRREQV